MTSVPCRDQKPPKRARRFSYSRHLKTILTSPVAVKISLAVAVLVFAYALVAGVAVRLAGPILLKHDNAFFLPIALAVQEKLGLLNPWFHPYDTPVGPGILDWHGIIHPLILGVIAPADGWTGINAAVVILSLLGMILYLGLIWRSKAPIFLKAICSGPIPALFMGFGGRPESTAALILGLIVLVNWNARNGESLRLGRVIASGVLLGLLGLAHPLAAVFSAAAYSLFIALHAGNKCLPPARYVFLIGAAAITSVASFGLFLVMLYPYETAVWLNGMLEASSIAADRSGSDHFLRYFVKTKHTPFLILTFIPFAYLLYLAGERAWKGFPLFYILAIFSLIGFLVLFVFRFPIAVPATYYNYTVLLPLLLVVFCRLRSACLWRPEGVISILCLSMFLFACTFGQAVWAYQTVAGTQIRKEQAARINALVESYAGRELRIAVDSPLIVAIKDDELAKSVDMLFFGRKDKDGNKANPSPSLFDIMIRAQSEFRKPGSVPGYTLIRNEFTKGYGALSFSKPEHLGFAVYRSNRWAGSPKTAPRRDPTQDMNGTAQQQP